MHILTRSSKNAFPRSRSRQDIHISSHIHRDTSQQRVVEDFGNYKNAVKFLR
ncbi:ABH_G0002650.mRNA.1.CDS.1 [Saccharomyces cerevisiae]|nr:BAK_1a_G0002660.mRNA.1.CDS.1 [Saccharomyces cerevisiae]CAI4259734.1 ABH_G0002650.mRNA.1.CDS.1 [Saccharomyces cerevisiae]CAI4270558.1 CCT_1a_G0002690.mRNA.1.CDS.1 [Saccharomyces cerevisiae]CAI6490556.1 ABH_G0002650.mRNA.1.CDS.1 [Saccharomyces cerevisiae]CAI7042822.1 BAK_1a_G0002660.mRNA.1.CDS.1 [Saccharomyces cerevisiae]